MNRKPKRIFRKILLSLLLISPLFLYISVVSIIQVAASSEKGPYVHWGGLDPHSEVYISWETLHEESSHIKYGDSPSNLSLSFDNSSNVRIHHARVSGLIPGTKYYYQVEDHIGNPFYGIGSFKTAPNPGESFNMTLISDTQQLLGIGHYEMVASAISRIQDTDFILDAGDVVQLEDDQKSWDYFFKVSEKYTNKFPLITVPGNHDGDDVNTLYTDYFTQPHPNGRYYSFNWSNTQFIMAEIADGGDVPKGIPENDLHYEWLNQTLENGQDKDYRVLIFHRNVFSSIGNDEGIMANIIPVVEHYNVSLTIYGHKHAYDRYFYSNYTYLCLGGGSGLQNIYVETQEFSEMHAMGPSISHLEFTPSEIRLKTVTTTNDVIEYVRFTNQWGFSVPEPVGGTNMWVLTPLFGVFFGFIFLTGVLIGFLWLGKVKPKKPWLSYLLNSLRAVMFSVFAYYAYLYLDSIVKVLGFGILGYGNIWFHATGLILMLLLAICFLFIAVFNAPTYQTFFTFACIVAFCIYFFEFRLPTFFIGEKDVLIRTPYIAITILIGSNIVTLPFRFIRNKRHGTFEFKKLWDISEKIKKIINFKSISVLWVFFMIESILQLEGLSILYWIGLL